VFTFACNRQGHLYTVSQVQDYVLRGTAFDDMNFLDFVVETYEIHKGKTNEELVDDDDSGHFSSRGRKRNLRGDYQLHHPKYETHERILRTDNHNYLPNIVGQWFPRRDIEEDEEFYFASVLALLRPWRDFEDLKEERRTWKEEGLMFLESATTVHRNVIAGMQYYYDSKSAAQDRNEDGKDCDGTDTGDADIIMDDMVDDDMQVMLKVW
jgi:hypothetical protein